MPDILGGLKVEKYSRQESSSVDRKKQIFNILLINRIHPCFNNRYFSAVMSSGSKNRIYLVGFMGVGKSTIGKQLAKSLGFEFLDLDKVFEQKYRISISSFFDKYDEDLFRRLEYNALKETFHLNRVVVSTGGGTACFFDAMELMNANGLTVYLEMTMEALFSRLKHARRKRPLVAYKADEELRETIAQKLDERLPFYRQATIAYPALDIDIKQLKARINSH